MTRRRPLLIAIEGVTGAGKTTLTSRLRRGGAPILFAGGYGGTRKVPDPFHKDLLGTIRRQLRRNEFLRLDWRVETLVLQAELLAAEATIVEPALAKGLVVLYEHYADSIYAYQAARLVEDRIARSMGEALTLVDRVLRGAPVKRRAHHTIVLETDASVAARRAAARDGRGLTKAARDFNVLVAAGYAALYAERTRGVTRVATADDAAEAITKFAAIMR